MNRQDLVNEVIEIVLECKTGEFKYMTVNWIAEELGVSLPYLSRVFKKETGSTLQKILAREKLFRGYLMLLEERELTVEEVAAALDYTTSHFIYAFSKLFSLSPGKLRREIEQYENR